MINKKFIQNHQCEKAKQNGKVLEQYKELDGRINWYLVKDSFNDSIQVNQCPFCKMFLPEYHYTTSEIEEICLLINTNELPEEEYSTKADLIQDWLDNHNIIAYADKSGENIQIRWDEPISKEELVHVYDKLREKYNVMIGVYFNHFVERKINDFPLTVNFVEMELKEYLLSIVEEKCMTKIS